MAISIDTETLATYEGLINDALTKTGKTDWGSQIEQATEDYNFENAAIIDYMSDEEKRLSLIYYCLAFIFRYMATSTEDIFYQKQKLYEDKYRAAIGRVSVDTDGDGEDDAGGYNIDLVR